jgi:hypothetical protein
MEYIGGVFRTFTVSSGWCDKDEKKWRVGVVACPYAIGEDFFTRLVMGKPPQGCPYRLEHVMTSQDEVPEKLELGP